jgi:hypothetical protein
MLTIKDVLNNEILRAEYSLKTAFKTEERDRYRLKLHELKLLENKLDSISDHAKILDILKSEIVAKQNQVRNSKINRSNFIIFRDTAVLVLYKYKEGLK